MPMFSRLGHFCRISILHWDMFFLFPSMGTCEWNGLVLGSTASIMSTASICLSSIKPQAYFLKDRRFSGTLLSDGYRKGGMSQQISFWMAHKQQGHTLSFSEYSSIGTCAQNLLRFFRLFCSHLFKISYWCRHNRFYSLFSLIRKRFLLRYYFRYCQRYNSIQLHQILPTNITDRN